MIQFLEESEGECYRGWGGFGKESMRLIWLASAASPSGQHSE